MIKRKFLLLLFLMILFKLAHSQSSKTEELFKTYLITDDDETAKAIIKANDNLYSIYCQAILTEDSSQQITLLTKFINLKPKYGLAQAYFIRGTAYTISLKYDSAIVDYNKSIELDPAEDATKFHFRSDAYLNIGDFDKALADANKEIQLTTKKAQPYVSRGVIYFKMQKYDLAIVDWKLAKKLDKDEAKDLDEMIESAKEEMNKQ